MLRNREYNSYSLARIFSALAVLKTAIVSALGYAKQDNILFFKRFLGLPRKAVGS